MKDPYDINQAQETAIESSTQEAIDQEIMKEAEKMEAENYDMAKEARMKLEKSAQQQKETTQKMGKQGEQIKKAKGAALNVHGKAGEAEALADDIEKESHFFNFSLPFSEKVKSWWKRDKKEEAEIERIKKQNEKEGVIEPLDEEDGLDAAHDAADKGSNSDEYVPGQDKTDKELSKILTTVKGINKEAQIQKEMGKKQTADLKDIDVVNEYSKRKVDKTDEDLKKGL